MLLEQQHLLVALVALWQWPRFAQPILEMLTMTRAFRVGMPHKLHQLVVSVVLVA